MAFKVTNFLAPIGLCHVRLQETEPFLRIPNYWYKCRINRLAPLLTS